MAIRRLSISIQDPSTLMVAESFPLQVMICRIDHLNILSLAFVRDEPVKSRPGLVVLLSHVPLAKIGRRISFRLQPRRPMSQPGRQLRKVVSHTVSVGIKARENARAAGRAQGRGTKGILKANTPGSYRIDVWSSDVL